MSIFEDTPILPKNVSLKSKLEKGVSFERKLRLTGDKDPTRGPQTAGGVALSVSRFDFLPGPIGSLQVGTDIGFIEPDRFQLAIGEERALIGVVG